MGQSYLGAKTYSYKPHSGCTNGWRSCACVRKQLPAALASQVGECELLGRGSERGLGQTREVLGSSARQYSISLY